MRRIASETLPAAYALLPEALRAPDAAILVLAGGLYLTGYTARRPMVRSSRRGFWQVSPDDVAELLKFTKGRDPLMAAARALGYGIRSMERGELQAALEHNDVLGCVVARCLLGPEADLAAAWRVFRVDDQPRWAESFVAAGMALAV